MDYRFNEDSLIALNAAGVGWQAALYVLTEGRPRLTRHIGSVLQVVATGPDGRRWLAVTLIEETDDHYLVVGGRWLDDDEADLMRKLMERRPRW